MKKLWSHSLVFKAFLTYLTIVGLLFASFYFYSSAVLRNLYLFTLGERLDHEVRLLSRALPYQLEGVALDTICQDLSRQLGARITVIAPDGRVLGDSAEPSSAMENHASRPEVIEATTRGRGSSVRYSTTVGNELLYRAFLHRDGVGQRIIRVAVPLSKVENVTSSLRPTLLFGLLAASGVGLFLAYAYSRHLTRRVRRLVEFSRDVAGGSFPQMFFPQSGQDEINLLEQHLNDMSAKLSDNVRQMIAEKDKVDSILRCMIEGVLVLAPKGQILLVNEQAKAMFHVAADREIHGISVLELSRHPEMRRMIEEVMAFDFSRKSYRKEVELGAGGWFQVNAASLNDAQGKLLGSVLVFHDISEIKRLESIRSDFVANVSHEIRTPLTAIRGYVETLLRGSPADPKDTERFLQIIERHSERLGRLTEDLLTLSDLESGKARIALGAVAVDQLLKGVLEVFRDSANKKNVALQRVVEPGLPFLLGDLDRLQQLFINLVDNAVKYTPGGGQVVITASNLVTSRGDERRVEIAVSDTGPGISQKELPRLTERFYRVDKARSRDVGGTGLGLAIVKHIAQAHGGELKIESILQKGTTVRVRLPALARLGRPKAILFICTGNSCRSQIAEGFARHLAPYGGEIYSAGTNPKGIHPLAIQVMKEVGIDISTQHSKGLDSIPVDRLDLMITLCGEAAEHCPVLPPRTETLHWPLRDPAAVKGAPEELLTIFREVRDDIRDRVQQLIAAYMEI